MVATPHAIEGLFPTTRDQVLRAVEELRQSLQEHGIPLELFPGQEIAFSPDVPDRLARRELLTMGDWGRAVLIEMPSAGFPHRWQDVLFDLQTMNLLPVIAHAERTVLVSDAHLLEQVRQVGAKLQVTARPMRNGRTRHVVGEWICTGDVVCIGSDGHGVSERKPVMVEVEGLYGGMRVEKAVGRPKWSTKTEL